MMNDKKIRDYLDAWNDPRVIRAKINSDKKHQALLLLNELLNSTGAFKDKKRQGQAERKLFKVMKESSDAFWRYQDIVDLVVFYKEVERKKK